MVTFEFLRKKALSFPEAVEEPHFERVSFRVRKKIFATYNKHKNEATLKLSDKDQDIFSIDSSIRPVPNKWGKQGWTVVEMDNVNSDLLDDALMTAYCEVAPKSLAEKVRPQ